MNPSTEESGAAPVLCRGMRTDDDAALVDLLTERFPDRTVSYWATAVDRLFRRAAELDASPGVVLEVGGALVGALLLIPGGTAVEPRCNLSSWCVKPPFAAYSALMANRAIRRRDLTYINVSPAPHTWATIEAQGFERYSCGRIAALPALMAGVRNVRVRPFDAGSPAHQALPSSERDLLLRHVGYGCVALVAEQGNDLFPFLFLRWRIGRWLPGAQLVYCRDILDMVRVGGGLGRYLLGRGMPVVLIDMCGPVAGIPGSRIDDRSPKYAKGQHRPRTGDLTDTELVMFGP